MDKKRGMSDIVVAMIMIVLVLVAVGIIWASLRGTIESGAEQIDLSTKCLEVNVVATALACDGVNNEICDVTFQREAGGDDIAGIKLVFTNASEEQSYTWDVAGNVGALETKTERDINTAANGLISDINSVEVVAYFKDSSGNDQVCPTRNKFVP